MRWLMFVLLTACGRIGFDTGSGVDAAGDDSASTTDGPPVDAPAGAMTLTFGEAPVAMIKAVTRDTYVSNEAGEPLFNYGNDNEVRIERDSNERALIAFDVTAIPTTATIFLATLDVTFTQIPPAPLPIGIHRVLESWDEGSQSGAGGVANYMTRSGVLTWTTAGGGTPGSATASLGQFVPALGRRTVMLPAAVVASWVASPSTNFGMNLISTSDDSTRFITSEGTPSADRPVLTVTFIP